MRLNVKWQQNICTFDNKLRYFPFSSERKSNAIWFCLNEFILINQIIVKNNHFFCLDIEKKKEKKLIRVHLWQKRWRCVVLNTVYWISNTDRCCCCCCFCWCCCCCSHSIVFCFTIISFDCSRYFLCHNTSWPMA